MSGGAGELEASDGTTLRFVDRGTGRPVVLLHGLGCTSSMWRSLASELAATHRVITVDLRGHGGSQPVAGGFDLDQQADDVRAVLVGLELRGAVVVGHSAGGYAALAFASRYPAVADERVAAIVTVGTSSSLRLPGERAVLWFSGTRAFYALLASPLGPSIVKAGAFGHDPDRSDVEQTRQMALACPRITKRAWVRAISGTSVDATLPAVTVPVIATTGSRDTTVPSSRLARFAAATGCQTAVFDGAGHMAPLERPGELATLIRDACHVAGPSSLEQTPDRRRPDSR